MGRWTGVLSTGKLRICKGKSELDGSNPHSPVHTKNLNETCWNILFVKLYLMNYLKIFITFLPINQLSVILTKKPLVVFTTFNPWMVDTPQLVD